MNEFFKDFKQKFDEFQSQKFSEQFNREVIKLGQSYGLMIKNLSHGQRNKSPRKYSDFDMSNSEGAKIQFIGEIKEFLEFMEVPYQFEQPQDSPEITSFQKKIDESFPLKRNKWPKVIEKGDPSGDKELTSFPKVSPNRQKANFSKFTTKLMIHRSNRSVTSQNDRKYKFAKSK